MDIIKVLITISAIGPFFITYSKFTKSIYYYKCCASCEIEESKRKVMKSSLIHFPTLLILIILAYLTCNGDVNLFYRDVKGVIVLYLLPMGTLTFPFFKRKDNSTKTIKQ